MGGVPLSFGTVWLAADQAYLKAGGTDGFAAPINWPQWYPGVDPYTTAKLRQAYRHGGAVPWSICHEVLPSGYLPDPTGTAYYVSEVSGPYDAFSGVDPFPSQFANMAWDWTTDAPPYTEDDPPYTFTPGAALASFLTVADADRNKMLLHPEHPVLSANDTYGFIYIGTATPPVTTLTSVASGAAVLGMMRRMQLIKAGVGSPSEEIVGSQSQYYSRVYGGWFQSYGLAGDLWFQVTYSAPNWTVINPPLLPYCWTFAAMFHGWLYNPVIDPETGAIEGALGVPEGAVFDVTANACFVKGDPNTYIAKATAMSWPNGIRRIQGGSYAPPGISGPDANVPQLVWRPAPAWRAFLRLEGKGTTGWWNATLPAFYDTSGPIYNGLEYEQPVLFRGYSHEMENAAINVTGDWKVLATFPDWDGTNLGEGVLSATLPTAGDEIIVTGYHPYMRSYGQEEAADMTATIYPDASCPRVAIPVMHGGVIQGALVS